MAEDDPDRRKFLKVATCALGGSVGLVAAVPALRLLADPAARTTVTIPTEPIDLGSIDGFRVGAQPRKVNVIAPAVKDAWTSSRNVVLGAAFISRQPNDKFEALSAVCPHLGCGVGWDAAASNFLCPCHDSRFAVDGAKLSGPSQRGLDPLVVEVKDGRLRLIWVRYRAGSTTRERA